MGGCGDQKWWQHCCFDTPCQRVLGDPTAETKETIEDSSVSFRRLYTTQKMIFSVLYMKVLFVLKYPTYMYLAYEIRTMAQQT